MKKVFIKISFQAGESDSYYVPTAGDFQTVGGQGGGSGEDKADRVKISQFVPGQSYCGVITRKILDKAGKFGISDLYFFKRVIGGTTAEGNLQFKETSDMIAAESNMLKERIRDIADGSLVIITYNGQHETKRYKFWDVKVDANYKPQGSNFNSNTARQTQQQNKNAQQGYTGNVSSVNQQNGQYQQPTHSTTVANNTQANQQNQQYGGNNSSTPEPFDDDLPF